MKKWLLTVAAVFLLAVLALGTGVTEASAAEKISTTSDGFSYKISKDNTVEITYYKGKKKKLKFPDKIKGKKVTKIGYQAVGGNQYVTSIIIPDTVTTVDIDAFWNYQNLTTITIGKNVRAFTDGNDEDESEYISLGKKFKAFKVSKKNKVFSAKDGVLFKGKILVKCPPTKKGTYRIPEGTRSMMLWAFDESQISTVKIPASVKYIKSFVGYDGGKCDSRIAAYEVDKGNKNYYDKDGVLFSKKEGVCLVHYPPQKKDASYRVPEEVIWVEDSAFAGHDYLEEVEIPNADVADAAFAGCPKLKKAVISGHLGEWAFFRCEELAEVEFVNRSDGRIIGLCGEQVFWDCGLRSLILSEDVPCLDSYALGGGTQCLKWIEIRNKDCEISVDKGDLPSKTIIYGYPGSTAEEYAKKAGLEFKTIEEQRLEIKNPKTVPKARIKLSPKTCTYDGQAQRPYVEVKDKSGKEISNFEYRVTYQNNKNVGEAVVKVKFKGYDYTGTMQTTFVIRPPKSKITKLTPGKNDITLQWKGVKASQISGYEIQYSTNSGFEEKNTRTVQAKRDVVKKKIKNLKSGKTYYTRIRSYKTIQREGKTERLYSKWSNNQKVKTIRR